MKMPSLKLPASFLVAALVVSGCDCGRRTVRARGEIGVIYEVDGAKLTSRDATYDFGSVFMGQTQTAKLVIKNLGTGLLTLDTLEKESGDAVTIGANAESNPVFDVRFEPNRPVEASEVVEFDMTFNALQNDIDKIVNHEVKLILRGANTEPGMETASITLKARAVSGVCELPKVLDFGAVAKGDKFKMTLELKNPSQIEATANVGDIYSSSGDHQAFTFTPDSARGTTVIPPNDKKLVSIEFAPTEIKSYLAFVKMRASAQCPEYAVSLQGQGVDNVLTWTTPVDFGYVTPGVEVKRECTFKNAGKMEVKLVELKTAAADFSIVPEQGQDPTLLTVPPQGEKKMTLAFKPALLGPRTSTLNFKTNLSRQPSGAVPLKGFGGGPDIQVVPSPTLNFGKVAYFSNVNPPSYQTRKLTVMNVGTKPTVADPNANLKLGKDGNGQGPLFDVEWKALNADTQDSELSITVPTSGNGAYNPAVGLEASAGKNLVDLIVKVTPTGLAKKSWEVTLHSNDPDEAAVKIVVNADVVQLPPCQYTVTPTALNFGLVTPPDYRDLSFTIKNDGANPGDICLLSSLDIGPGSDAIFSLPGGSVASKELQPGETVTVSVRAWPQGQVPQGVNKVTGNAQFFMSSPTKPETKVQLEAAIAAGCLTIAPDDLDFGTVQKGCYSSKRTFTIYNTCSTAIPINGNAVLQAAAGQPAGGPDCPGATACPEFHLLSNSIAGTLQPSANVSFAAAYRPIDLGNDTGAIAINATQNGQNVTYVVTLKGKGDTVGLNTDVFKQDVEPKADILLVVDNSGSMSDKQQAMANNFSSFIKYAVSAKVDYRIAVVTTDMNNAAQSGRFITGAAHPEKVLTKTTPSVESKFKAKVNVGISGSGMEEEFRPALAALTAPLITSDNAGFLRNEASLAIVAVTDELEQSPQPVTYYYNNFMNIKGFNRANMFTFNAIAGFNTAQSGSCYRDLDDGRLASMVSQTNGIKEDICTPDWAKALEQLGKTAFGFRTNFFLNGTPDLTNGKKITVKIDGVDIDAVDPITQSRVWSYDSVANSVNFEPMFVPEPGQTLTITYYVTCYTTPPP